MDAHAIPISAEPDRRGAIGEAPHPPSSEAAATRGRLAALPGDVLVRMHPFYAYEAGKPPAAQIQALWHARWRGRDPLPADFVARIQNREYSAIISDQSPYFETEPALLALIDANYVPSETLDIQDSPPTMSGLIVRPRLIVVPR